MYTCSSEFVLEQGKLPPPPPPFPPPPHPRESQYLKFSCNFSKFDSNICIFMIVEHVFEVIDRLQMQESGGLFLGILVYTWLVGTV